MASTCDLYTLLSAPKRESSSPVSSNDSINDKSKSDEESYDDSNSIDYRGYSVKERGRILNLAPVRECAAPEMTFQERQEHYQQNYVALNQYLNLMTPPLPANRFQYEIDEARIRRNGYRIMNTGDNNLFPACTPRRGARPLRLGSAEFLKPGIGQNEPKWNMERKYSSASVNNQTSTVPGTIIVGSTVIPQTPSVLQMSRGRSGGKRSPYIQFQREQLQSRQNEKPQTPPQHVSGKKFKPCERVADLTSSAKEKTRLTYTHGATPERQVIQLRSATMVDWPERPYTKKDKASINLDVNHLGIRGRTFKPDEQLTIYKHRRTATLNS